MITRGRDRGVGSDEKGLEIGLMDSDSELGYGKL